MSLSIPSPATAEQLAARLQTQARYLEQELQALLALPIDEQSDSAALANQLEAALKDFWNASQPHGAPRFSALIALFRQHLHDEVALKIADGSLAAAHQFYLPAPSGSPEASLDIYALHLADDDQRSVEVHGALVFGRDDGPCLLYLPGQGVESFVSLQNLREDLAGRLDTQVAGSLLLRNTVLEYQHNVAQLDSDPELSAAPLTTADIKLLPLSADPFAHAIKSLINKQRNDVAWACAREDLRDGDRPRWQLGIQAALDIRDLLGPAAMLRIRQHAHQLRTLRLQAPQWLYSASPEERSNWINSLNAYEQARLVLQSLMQGCASLQQFANSRLAERIHSDLGYDLAQQVQVTTRRRSPLGQEPYVQNRTLEALALHGLHPDDLNDDSDFQTTTDCSLDGLSLRNAYPLLTPQWLATTVTQLDLRTGFGEAQRHIFGNTQVKDMIGQVIHRQILFQAWNALYQGHIQPADFLFTDVLQHAAPTQIRVQQVLWQQELLGEMLLFRLPQPDGSSERLLLFARDIPRELQLQAFDNERQLMHELVSWSRTAHLRQYLLDQVPAAQRPALERQLQALQDKAQPAADLLGFREHSSFSDALYAMSTAHIRLKIDEQRQYTPDWLRAASPEQRRELQSLDDAIEALSQDYQQQAHTRTPDYERFVQRMASSRLNALLQLPDGSVDPDQIIITSARETLSYTRMLRDGYDDSLGFLSATAADQATFTGPPGVDLSRLTPETVAGSVRGAWPSDAWIAHVRKTLLDPQSEGYAYRRRLSLLLVQLQMRSAALRSLLTHAINATTYAWLKASIEHMQHADAQSRQRYPVHPLRFLIDNPFIASVPALGDIMKTMGTFMPMGVPVSRMETAQGCHILFAQAETEQAMLYTPDAPDGLAFRPLSRFMETLHNDGMSDYYRNRCHRVMGRILAFYFIELKKRTDGPPPVLPDKPYDDLHEVCYERVLQRQLRDIEDTTEGRGDMLAKVVINSIEMLAMAVTLPFPPASFAVGIGLAMRDSVRALAALGEGDQSAASLHVLSTWLNLLGAAGDATVGLKGFGGVLQQLADRGGHNPPLAALRQTRNTSARLFRSLGWYHPSAAPSIGINTHRRLVRAAPHDPQKLLASGFFSQEEVARLIRPLAPESALPARSASGQPPSAYAVRQSLDNTPPIASGHAKGVTWIDGHYYLRLDDRVYEVQYSASIRLWQIIDPANPYAFFGKQPVHLTDSGQWKTIDAFKLRGGGRSTFALLDNQPVSPATSSATPSVNAAYEMPEKWKHQVTGIVDNSWMPIDDFGMDLSPAYFATYFKEPRALYRTLRNTLREDTLKFFEQVTPMPRAELPALDDNLSVDALLKRVFEHNHGLVVSEAARSVASKRLLIENMPRLAEQNVEIIYIEHLFTDVHLHKLEKYLTRAGKKPGGSAELKMHLDSLNQGALHTGSLQKHDYYHVIKAAHRHGIQIKPLSSSVSYDFLHSTAAIDDPTLMRNMSVFFASRLISADTAQAPARRWVALVEQQRANTYQQSPGIAELHGAISLRAQDVARDKPMRIVPDLPSNDGPASPSFADWRLELPDPQRRPAPAGAASVTPATAAEADELDMTLEQLLGRPEPASPAGQSIRHPLHDNPGPHGFELDAAGQWQRADAARWPTGGEPTALQRSMAEPLYQMPDEHLDAFHELAFFEKRGLNMFYSNDKEHLAPARELFFKQRARLLRDAQQLTNETLPGRPILPDVTGQTSQTGLLDDLYARTQGLLIGEYHSSIASKQFIIDNLPHLAKNQVKTLYLEHLQIDVHQLDLDLFAETGQMSKRLLHYLKHIDRGFFTDPSGRYTFEQLIIKAREYGVEVRALDCAPGYYLGNMPNPSRNDRIIMMNYFASRTIRRHQQVVGPHKWLALVGEAHTNSFDKAVPGLAELLQGISLRVYDLPPGQSFGPAGDPGRMASTQLGRHTSFIRNDYALGLPTHHGNVTLQGKLVSSLSPTSLEARLFLPGQFTVEGADSASPVIVHRSRANRLERTPVLKNPKGRLYIERERWASVHLRQFDTLAELIQALRGLNLTKVD